MGCALSGVAQLQTIPESLPDAGGIEDGSGHSNPPSPPPTRFQRSRLIRPSGTNFLRLSGQIGRDIALITNAVNALLSGVLANRRSLKEVHSGHPFNFSTEPPPPISTPAEGLLCKCDPPSGFIEKNRVTLLVISVIPSVFSLAWTTFTCIAYLRKGYICNVAVARVPPPTRVVIQRDSPGHSPSDPFLPGGSTSNQPALRGPDSPSEGQKKKRNPPNSNH